MNVSDFKNCNVDCVSWFNNPTGDPILFNKYFPVRINLFLDASNQIYFEFAKV